MTAIHRIRITVQKLDPEGSGMVTQATDHVIEREKSWDAVREAIRILDPHTVIEVDSPYAREAQVREELARVEIENFNLRSKLTNQKLDASDVLSDLREKWSKLEENLTAENNALRSDLKSKDEKELCSFNRCRVRAVDCALCRKPFCPSHIEVRQNRKGMHYCSEAGSYIECAPADGRVNKK